MSRSVAKRAEKLLPLGEYRKPSGYFSFSVYENDNV